MEEKPKHLEYDYIKKSDIGSWPDYELDGFEIVKGGIDSLEDGEELFGFGFNGVFQRGVFYRKYYIKFDYEFGGVKNIREDGLVSKTLKTCYSPIYRKKS